MDPENSLTAINIGCIDDHLSVKTARTQERTVKHVRPIGRGKHDYASVCGDPVHFHQQLIKGLLALVVDCAHVDAALPANGIQFIDENDAGCFNFGLLEEITDTSGAH